jgi:hypothetical protein
VVLRSHLPRAISGKAFREQVITRQPAAEKRLTVAWPMPRLAPVSRSVRRCWLGCDVGMRVRSRLFSISASRVEACLVPGRAWAGSSYMCYQCVTKCVAVLKQHAGFPPTVPS